MQLTHTGISLLQGHTYKANFTMVGVNIATHRYVEVRIGEDYSPYDAYAEFGPLNVASTSNTWSQQFVVKLASTTDARFEFNAGQSLGNIQISNVSVTCLDCSSSSSSSSVSSSTSSSTTDTAIAYTNIDFATMAENLAHQTAKITAPNGSDSVWLMSGSTITMNGFPTGWNPNTLVLQINPDLGEQLNCTVELDDRLFSITGWYAEIHVPFHGELTDVANISSCVSGSARDALVSYWVDNSGTETTPNGQVQPDAVALDVNTWKWVDAGDTASFEVSVRAGARPQLEFQGNGNVTNVQAFINGTPLNISMLPYVIQSDLLVAGDYRIDLVAGTDASLGFRWTDAPATWSSIILPTHDSVGMNGKLSRAFDFSSVPGVTGSFTMAYATGTFVDNVAPVVTASPRPAANSYLQSGMAALGPEYHVVANIAADSTVTFAFPLPLDSSSGKVQNLAVHLESDDNLTSTWLAVDSISNGMAYFHTTHFCSGGLVAYGGTSGFYPSMVASALQPMTSGGALFKNPAPEAIESMVYSRLLSQLTWNANSANPVDLTALPLGQRLRPSWNNLEILLADRIQHKLDPTKPLRWGTVNPSYPGLIKYDATVNLWGVGALMDIAFLPTDPTKDIPLQFQPTFSLKAIENALASYNSCDDSYLAPLCLSELLDLQQPGKDLTDPSRDDYLLSSLDIFTDLQMLAWVDPTLDHSVISAMDAMEKDIRTFVQLTANLYGHNNIPTKAQAALALASLRRAPMGTVPTADKRQQLMNFGLDMLAYGDLNELQTDYVSKMYDASGSFAEGVGYLTFVNQNMYPLYGLGIKSGKLKQTDVPDLVKQSIKQHLFCNFFPVPSWLG